MTPTPQSADHLVEQLACGLEETFAPEGGSLGRHDRSEVVLLPRLRAALEPLNPDQPAEAIEAAAVIARKDDTPAAVHAAMANVAGWRWISGGGGLIQITSG